MYSDELPLDRAPYAGRLVLVLVGLSVVAIALLVWFVSVSSAGPAGSCGGG